jgi:hypothetical protein
LQADIRKGGGKFCSPICYHASRKGVPLPRRTDGVRVENGYRLIYMPDHPRAKSNGYVREHLLIAEQTLGRPLTPNEIVHHINFTRDDNRPENLQILSSQSEHMSLHMRALHERHPLWRYLSADAKRNHKIS